MTKPRMNNCRSSGTKNQKEVFKLKNPSSTIVDFQKFKAKRLRKSVEQIVSGMTPEDFDTLQNDVLIAPIRRSILPTCMTDDFREWLNDCYGPIERECKMAPECQADTETMFLEEVADGDDETLSAMATQLLAIGHLVLREIQLEEASESPVPA